MEYSVLMSVYAKDNSRYLRQAIESMLNQTAAPEQFVLVKDGSLPEETEVVINEYVKLWPQLFTIVALEENGGLGRALDEGLKFCRNELVARMDADDISLPGRCEKELALFRKNSELAICGCNIDEFYDEPENVHTVRRVPSEYSDIKRFMRRRQPFNHPTVMFKKSEVIRCGGYGKIPRKEDFDLFSRMLMQGCYAQNIDESLYLYRTGADNYKRRKSWKNCKSAFYVYKRHLARKGCTLADYAIMCTGELVFFVSPMFMMKWLSDSLLRSRK